MSTEDVLRQFIVAEMDQAPTAAALTHDYPLIANRVIDSLGIYQLVSFIESRFGIEIDDEDLVPEHFGTLGGMTRLIERHAATPSGTVGTAL